MKYTELANKSADDLRKQLAQLQEKAAEVRRNMKLGQVKNMHELAGIRKDIARILTHLRAN